VPGGPAFRGLSRVGIRIAFIVLAAALFGGLAKPAIASGLDSEHLFGLTEGSDIGTAGERELELEAAVRTGKGGGTYRVLSQATALKLTLTDSFRVSPLVAIDRHNIGGVPGLLDRNQWAFSEVAFEMKYRVLDRQAAPFGFTLVATPSFARIDETSGERTESYGVGFAALADRELIANRLMVAFNAAFATGASQQRMTGVWEHDSALAASAALSGRVSERVFVSGEVRYERAFDGMGLDRFAGHSWFVGPAIYVRLSEQAWMSVVWNTQIAGRAAGEVGSLDLTNFERHLFKARLGIAF
jgi:hypothetical protein